jgi:hypothetical protein
MSFFDSIADRRIRRAQKAGFFDNQLNERIDEYNRTTTWERRDRLGRDDVLDQWRRVRVNH